MARSAAADLLDSVTVSAYDKTVPLSQVAQVSVRDAQTLWVAIFDPLVGENTGARESRRLGGRRGP